MMSKCGEEINKKPCKLTRHGNRTGLALPQLDYFQKVTWPWTPWWAQYLSCCRSALSKLSCRGGVLEYRIKNVMGK